MNVQADENEIDQACDKVNQDHVQEEFDSDYENDIQEKQRVLQDMFLDDDDDMS